MLKFIGFLAKWLLIGVCVAVLFAWLI